MKSTLITIVLALGIGMYAQSALADKDNHPKSQTLVMFEGGIGDDPVAGIDPVTGMPIRNDVHGVPPGGRPWVIEKLMARITVDGKIHARGKGLLLGATDAIGTIGSVQMVAATLFCGAQAFNSTAVTLGSYGEFEIQGPLDALPPNPCDKPVLLIRNAPGGIPGAWFAAGILEVK